MGPSKRFLFSIDLEEFYAEQPDFKRTPLPELTGRYLEFLRRHRMKATFFVVGQVAEQFRSTIREIHAEGHELACHTYSHLPLDQYGSVAFEEDLKRNLAAIQDCVEADVTGFRAPILSLTEQTQWAYEVLGKLGFQYSSSVLPSKNPLYGWQGFGVLPRKFNGVNGFNGITEIPVTLTQFLGMQVPLGAGTYFRCLPFSYLRRCFRRCAEAGTAVIGYFHPYDIDFAQEKVMSRGVRGSRLLNELLYVNRAKTLDRLEQILLDDFEIVPYRDYLRDLIAS